jgi:hypothetical protein
LDLLEFLTMVFMQSGWTIHTPHAAVRVKIVVA